MPWYLGVPSYDTEVQYIPRGLTARYLVFMGHLGTIRSACRTMTARVFHGTVGYLPTSRKLEYLTLLIYCHRN